MTETESLRCVRTAVPSPSVDQRAGLDVWGRGRPVGARLPRSPAQRSRERAYLGATLGATGANNIQGVRTSMNGRPERVRGRGRF